MSKDFKPMLAAKDASKICFPVVASPKIDGVRAIVRNGQVLSRSLKLIPNRHVQKLFATWGLEGCDGELVVGEPTAPDCMQATTSGVMRIEGEPLVTFFVFDCITHPSYTFAERLLEAEDLVTGYNIGSGEPTHLSPVQHVEHTPVNSQEELDGYETRCLEKGYEGVMVRDPKGVYKFGRSTAKEGGLVKIKRFEDAEAMVIGFEEREHNDNEKTVDNLGHSKRSTHKENKRAAGDLGALVCQRESDGVVFNVGTGFSAAQRKVLWETREALRGKIVKYKHFAATGVKDAPRIPVFVGFRDPRDT